MDCREGRVGGGVTIEEWRRVCGDPAAQNSSADRGIHRWKMHLGGVLNSFTWDLVFRVDLLTPERKEFEGQDYISRSSYLSGPSMIFEV